MIEPSTPKPHVDPPQGGARNPIPHPPFTYEMYKDCVLDKGGYLTRRTTYEVGLIGYELKLLADYGAWVCVEMIPLEGEPHG